jgi:hypothetical protein
MYMMYSSVCSETQKEVPTCTLSPLIVCFNTHSCTSCTLSPLFHISLQSCTSCTLSPLFFMFHYTQLVHEEQLCSET